MACVIYKLSHDSILLICNELFAINKSTIVLVIFEVIKNINIVLKSLISWLVGQNMKVVMLEFKND
jgi:hypothetical protein